MVRAIATLRPYLSRMARLRDSRHRRPPRGFGRSAAARRGSAPQARLLGRLQRKPAGRAAAVAQEFDPLPAIGAEAVDVARRSSRSRRSAAEARNRAPSERRPANDAAKRSIASCRPRRRIAQARAVPDLFDMKLRALRRDRAARIGPELFLFERAFDDCLERIALMNRAVRARAADRLPRRRLAGAAGAFAAMMCVDPGRCSPRQRAASRSSRMHGSRSAEPTISCWRSARSTRSTICRSRCV